jgi:hypothetical protein
MKIRCILQPGQRGTKRLLEKYGDNLVCIRYRYDDEKQMMYKTAEIIIDRKPWQRETRKMADDQIVSIRVAYHEVDVRRRVKAAGGKWDPTRQVWHLDFKNAAKLGLASRIVDTESKDSDNNQLTGSKP